MEAPCVKVDRTEGERTRQTLAEADLVDRRFRIAADDGSVYIPVTTETAVPAHLQVVTRSVQPREGQTLPRDLLDEAPTYERLGDIALIDEDDPARAREVASALMEASLPIKTVLNQASKIEGAHRIRKWDLLAGEETETVHREFGHSFRLDVTDVYFSPRLATERHRVVSQITAEEHVIDMFAGVGPFAIPMAAHGARVVAVDLNPRAIRYLEENAETNRVSDRIIPVCGDIRDIASEYAGWADRLVMNLPHTANEFLDVAQDLAGERCRLHYYDIQHEADPFGAGEEAIRAAFEPNYTVTVAEERIVRSYAPHEVNICLDVDVVASNR